MDEIDVESAARNPGGKIQDAIGAVTGAIATQARGQVNRAAREAKPPMGRRLMGYEILLALRHL